MKKILFVLLFLVVSMSAFSQVREFGGRDVWSFYPEDVTIDGDYVELYFNLDMSKTTWTGFDPIEEGLSNVGMMFEFSMKDPDQAFFLFAYESMYQLKLNNYIVVHLMNGDAWLLGGIGTSGDESILERVGKNYICATGIYLDPEWINWFVNNAGGYYTFGIYELNYRDNLWFQIPEEVFQIIGSYYNKYHGNLPSGA